MLGKLYKYECQAAFRVLGPLFLVFLALSAIFRPFDMLGMKGSVYVLLMMVYSMMAAALAVMSFAIIIQRFHKTMLGNEGYLMHTLPVPIWQHILVKLLTALTITFAGGLVAILSIMLFTFQLDFDYLMTGLKVIFMGWGDDLPYMVEGLIYSITIILSTTCAIYASMCIGHCLPKLQILGSVIVFNVFRGIESAVNTAQFEIFHIYGNPHMVTFMDILTNLVFFGLYFYLVNYILSKHLNLE